MKLGPERPLVGKQAALWEAGLRRLRDSDTARLNREIDRYNLVVPMMREQLFHFALDAEAKRILDEPPVRKDEGDTAKEKVMRKIVDQKKAAGNTIAELLRKMFRLLGEMKGVDQVAQDIKKCDTKPGESETKRAKQ